SAAANFHRNVSLAKQNTQARSCVTATSAGRLSMLPKRFTALGWLLCFCAAVLAQSSSLTDADKKSTKPTANALKHAVVIPPEKKSPVVVPRFDKPPVIDGKPDE